METKIILVAFNARYSHAAFGARYLLANLGDLQEQTQLLEFDLQIQPRTAVEKILAHQPRIVGIGCYIWNIALATQVAALLKTLCPEIKIILGGPEISYETKQQEIFQHADHVICGEGETEFPKLCRTLISDATIGFNPHQEIHQTCRKNLPHWTQDGNTYFITFRLADSIAQSRIKAYEELRQKWNEHHHPPYSEKEREQFNELFSERVNKWLDEGAGSCCLKDPNLAVHIAETLQHFDGERYELDEWVVMPNHVHVLVKPLAGFELSTILHTWKSYSAHAINKVLQRKNQLWQPESYDHLVRNSDELFRIRNYIRRNPEKAGIQVAYAGSRRAACDTKTAHPVPQAARLLHAEPVDTAQINPNPEQVAGAGSRRAACDTKAAYPVPQAARLLYAKPVDTAQIKLPYTLYSDDDLAHRALYVEASRGCPFRCEYCMSSLDPAVRYFPEEKLFASFEKLLQRGARVFKFVDRTFNIDIDFALKLLAFFRKRHRPSMMIHFEVIPDRLPPELLTAIQQCPAGMLQFEIGIQTFNPEVAARIQRPLNIEKIETNLRCLRNETDVHIHSDLIAGLPGEDLESFEAGFNQLLALNPQEIQLGILKRLRGAPIDRHSAEWNMVYSPHAPYEILQTSCISFQQMQQISRFARYWNLTVNNGQFIHTAPLIWKNTTSPFAAFMTWSNWLYAQTNTTGNLHLVRLSKLLLEFLTIHRKLNPQFTTESLLKDYQRGNRSDLPKFLKSAAAPIPTTNTPPAPNGLSRQARHQNK